MNVNVPLTLDKNVMHSMTQPNNFLETIGIIRTRRSMEPILTGFAAIAWVGVLSSGTASLFGGVRSILKKTCATAMVVIGPSATRTWHPGIHT